MHPSSSKRNQAGQPSTSSQRRPRPTRELPECPICTMTVKDPKLLLCGHSLCGPQSEEKCLLQWERRQQVPGEIKCPVCQKVHQMKASDALTPFGFRELLESFEDMVVCERHNMERKYYCHDHKQQICEICWKEDHLHHNIDLIEIAELNKLSSQWERQNLEALRKLCLQAVEVFGEGVDFFLGKQERYTKIADMCLSLQRKQPKIDKKFQQKQFDHDDEDIAEFEHFLEYIERDSEKLAADLVKLDDLSAELKRLTDETASELEKRLGEAVVSTETVSTDTIIAFGDWGNNEIWRRGTNKWTKWEKGRDCGEWYACVKAHSNIYLIGGARRGQPYSPETDIYDISKEQWTKGPQLKTARRGASACFDATRNHIFVVGGYSNCEPLNSVERLKLDKLGRPTGTWEKFTDMTSMRHWSCAVLLDDKLFVSGGYTGSGLDTATASVEVLDLKSTTTDWKQCAPMHEERGEHAMIAFNNQLFVFGGWNGSNRLASCEKYSPINNTWQMISNMRVPRNVCGVCLIGDRIYVVGGWCDKSEDNKTVEKYDPDRDEWTQGPSLTRPIDVTKCVAW